MSEATPENRIISADFSQEDRQEAAIRPQNLGEFVGQNK